MRTSWQPAAHDTLPGVQLAISGHTEDAPDDPFWLVPAMADVQHFPELSQKGLEDLQLFAFLTAIAGTGGPHPLEVAVPESDPPDRLLTVGGHTYALELTELTLQDLRADLGPVRAFGRALQERLEGSQAHDHLRGRLIQVMQLDRQRLDRPMDSLEPILEALKEDKGSLADIPIDASRGLPEKVPEVGFYGNIGGFNVHLNGGPGVEGRILVSASVNGTIHKSQALGAVRARIAKKDEPQNEVLLITCGLPDKRGYLCAIDQWIFNVLAEVAASSGLEIPHPEHLKAILLHDFARGTMLEAYVSADARPFWRAS